MMRWLVAAMLFIPTVALAQVPAPADLEQERAELLRIHAADREAHFQTDVELLQVHSPEEFLAVSAGKIYRSTKAEERKRFAEYFSGATYFEWDDLEEPIVRVSKDGSMAWMITRIRVRRVQKDTSGAEREQKFVYAGITTYEKQENRWVRIANVSTFEPQA